MREGLDDSKDGSILGTVGDDLSHDFDQKGRGLSGVGRGGGTPPTRLLRQCYVDYDLDDEDRNEFAYGMRKDGSLADNEAQIEGLVGPRNAYINQELN